MRIAHVTNPVRVPAGSDLFEAQPITFRSILAARDEARRHDIDVDLFTVQYSEDRDVAPGGFVPLPDLQRSVLDCGVRGRRKLPLIRDILGALHEHSSGAELMIYTNVDIALMPFFYLAVADTVRRGHDAIIVNRRTVVPSDAASMPLSILYSLAGCGHPGWDCFVFHRDLFPGMDFGDTCIGAPLIGQALYANLALVAASFTELTDRHMTFHIGDDRTWTGRAQSGYWEHNRRQLQLTLRKLESRFGRMDRRQMPGRFWLAVDKNPVTRKLRQIYYRATS